MTPHTCFWSWHNPKKLSKMYIIPQIIVNWKKNLGFLPSPHKKNCFRWEKNQNIQRMIIAVFT